jgi:predicted regulator of Ras-like GTPase activity (Roadblock/LC7/MglB family)
VDYAPIGAIAEGYKNPNRFERITRSESRPKVLAESLSLFRSPQPLLAWQKHHRNLHIGSSEKSNVAKDGEFWTMAIETSFKELQDLMRRIEQSSGLEALAVVTREGIRLACAVSDNVDSDVFSAATATLVNVGEETLRQLSQGTLSEVILRGNKGFTIIMRGTPETLLVGASRDQIRLGYYIGLMKIYATKVTKILEAHPLQLEQFLGFRRMPFGPGETEAPGAPARPPTPAPTPAPTPKVPTPRPEPVAVERPKGREPKIAPVEAPTLETVSIETAEEEEADDVSVDDKEAILAALKALGFDEPE